MFNGMFGQEINQAERQPTPEFESGFNQVGDIIVKINRDITSKNIVKLTDIIDKFVGDCYKTKPKHNETNLILVFDASGNDFECVSTFVDFVKLTTEKYPKLKFKGLLEHAEGSVAIMYMTIPERIVNSDEMVNTQNGPTRMGKSSLKFNCVSTEVKNAMAKLLLGKIKKEVLQLCFPPDEKSAVCYCGNLIFDDGFGTHLN